MTLPEITARLRKEYTNRGHELIAQLQAERQEQIDLYSERIREKLLKEFMHLKLQLDEESLRILQFYEIDDFSELELVELVNVCYKTVEYFREVQPHALGHLVTIKYSQKRSKWPRK